MTAGTRGDGELAVDNPNPIFPGDNEFLFCFCDCCSLSGSEEDDDINFEIGDNVIVKNYQNPWQHNKIINGISGIIKEFKVDSYDPTFTINGVTLLLNHDEKLINHINDQCLGSILMEENSTLWIPLTNIYKC